MSQKFIVVVKPFSVITSPGKTTNVNAITEYFLSNNWKTWHWIDNMWLLSEVADEQSPRTIWEDLKLKIAVPLLDGVVIDPVKSTYWGNSAKEGWEWMRMNWGTADLPPAITAVTEDVADSSTSESAR